MPALTKALESARAAHCLGNMKQVMSAQRSYADDNNEIMIGYAMWQYTQPWNGILTNTYNMDERTSDNKGYTSYKTVICPSIKKRKNSGTYSLWNSSYGVLNFSGNTTAFRDRVGNIFNTNTTSDNNNCFFYLKNAKFPSRTFIHADTVTNSDRTSSPGPGYAFWKFKYNVNVEYAGVGTIHNGRATCGFLDGHANALTGPGMNKTAIGLTYFVNEYLIGVTLGN